MHRAFRQGISVPKPEDAPRPQPASHGREHGQSRVQRRQRSYGIVLRAAAEERPRPPNLDHPRATPHRDGDLDRTDLPP
ncbi:MAG: hypothetical protein B7X41_02035, partial [Microbacterium sp. 14-71-5]